MNLHLESAGAESAAMAYAGPARRADCGAPAAAGAASQPAHAGFATRLFDPEPLLESLENDWPTFVALATMFGQSSDDNMQRLGAAVADSDFAAVNAEAHALKGSLSLLRGEPARSIAETIELASRKGTLTDFTILFAELGREMQRLREELSVYCASRPDDSASLPDIA